MATLDETGAKVNVAEVQNGAIGKEKIAAQAAAAFATAPADAGPPLAADRGKVRSGPGGRGLSDGRNQAPPRL
jgi:hypothetical protein